MRAFGGSTVWAIAAPVGLLILWGALGDTFSKEAVAGSAEARPGSGSKDAQIARGRELFVRHWLPKDPRSREGDGLGPLYNATSCSECHRQGGLGGAGPSEHNVEVATLRPGLRRSKKAPLDKPLSDFNLDEFHPGFRTADSVILHRHSTSPEYRAWRLRRVDGVEHAEMAESGGDADRARVRETLLKGDPEPRSLGRKSLEPARLRAPNRVSGATLLGRVAFLTQRNTPSLFGAGLIDAIPVEAFEEAARLTDPKIRGKMNKLGTGRVGRFGWKAQAVSLKDFVMSACAVELGLEVPGHHQARPPLDFATTRTAKLDLNEEDCDALTAFIASLPQPSEASLPVPEAQLVSQGHDRFLAIGCADCHRPRLGPVTGIYSDLLLHDMGSDLSDSGNVYYGTETRGRVLAQEWRTPPLWGFRDSGPYLHDGRARTLEQTVALHGGQAEQASKAYFALKLQERLEVEAFLNSLVAPAVP